MPEDILTKLGKLKDQGFNNPIVFTDAVSRAIGREAAEAYRFTDKSMTSLHPRESPRRYWPSLVP